MNDEYLMDLAGYRALVGELIGSAWDSGNWTEAMLDSGIRQALREYENLAPVVELSVRVETAGAEQVITRVVWVEAEKENGIPTETLVHPGRPLALAWPWYEGAKWESLAVRWRQVGETETGVVVILENGIIPQVKDIIRARVRARQTIKGLDGAKETTTAARDEKLVVLGAAGFAAGIRARQHQESFTTTSLAMRDVRAWSEDRLREFRQGLVELAMYESPFVAWRSA